MKSFIKKFALIHKLEDIRSSRFYSTGEIGEGIGKRKGPKDFEFLSKIAKEINKRISFPDKVSAPSKVFTLFSNWDFQSWVKDRAAEIFSYSQREAKLTQARQFFTINNPLVQGSDGNYKFELDITFNSYAETGFELTPQMLSNIDFFVIKGEVKEFNEVDFGKIKGYWTIVNRRVSSVRIENGLMLINKPQVKIPDGISLGFIDFATGNTIEGVVINKYDFTESKMMMLKGPVFLNPNTGLLEALSDTEVANLLYAWFTFLLKNTGIQKMEKLVKINAERGADFFQFILNKPLTPETMTDFLDSLPKVFGRNGLMWFEHIEAVLKKDKVIMKAFHSLGEVWSQYYIMLSDYTMENFFNYHPIKETKNYSESSIFLEYVPIK